MKKMNKKFLNVV